MRIVFYLLFSLLFLAPYITSIRAQCPPDTVFLKAFADNTLYGDTVGISSNGIGNHLFIGKTGIPELRRALIKFDIASALPVGSVVSEVSLTLYMSKTNPIAPSTDAYLHRCLADWGEGTSDAPGNEGTPAAATPGDATWTNNLFPGSFWTNPGGDFDSVISASVLVGPVGYYTWASTPQLVSNIQDWLDTPANNFGWEMLGREDTVPNAKRFDTRENPDLLRRPSLRIVYTPASSLVNVELGENISVCPGGTVTLDATNPRSTYLWSTAETTPTIVVSTPAFYHVTVTDTTAGCGGTAIDTANVGAGVTPVAGFGQSADSIDLAISGDVAFSDSSSSATEWCWNFGDGDTSTAMSPTHTYSSVGTYTVTQYAKNGVCADTSTSTVVAQILVSIQNEFGSSISFYPNPASEILTLVLPAGHEEGSFSLFDLNGKLVLSKNDLWLGDNPISLQGVSSGTYFFEVENRKGILEKGKIVVIR